jgi:diguanylate cyclase
MDNLILPQNLVEAHRAGMAHYLSTNVGKILNKRLELPAQRKDGTELTVEVRIHPVDLGPKKLFCAFLHDISDRKDLEMQRESEARHDALTGLLNRRALTELLPLAQARGKRNQLSLGVLFIDLDGFKSVNDTHGHEAGDELLRVVAERLRKCVREADSVIRLAGDEFTVLLEGIKDRSGALVAARKILAQICEPISLPGYPPMRVGASIGIALHQPGSTRNPTALMRKADELMYEAKAAGKGRIVLEPAGSPQNSSDEIELEV